MLLLLVSNHKVFCKGKKEKTTFKITWQEQIINIV